jgi:hypothetical protein
MQSGTVALSTGFWSVFPQNQSVPPNSTCIGWVRAGQLQARRQRDTREVRTLSVLGTLVTTALAGGVTYTEPLGGVPCSRNLQGWVNHVLERGHPTTDIQIDEFLVGTSSSPLSPPTPTCSGGVITTSSRMAAGNLTNQT